MASPRSFSLPFLRFGGVTAPDALAIRRSRAGGGLLSQRRWNHSRDDNDNDTSTTSTASIMSTLVSGITGSTEEKNQSRDNFEPAYVHHLSKVALQYLQTERHEWTVEKGLDRSLYILPNGCFLLNFPKIQGEDGKAQTGGRMWYVDTLRLLSYFVSKRICSLDSNNKMFISHNISLHSNTLYICIRTGPTTRLAPDAIGLRCSDPSWPFDFCSRIMEKAWIKDTTRFTMPRRLNSTFKRLWNE